jgi:flagellar biosynthesis/type III secretory pathway chaperone
VTVGSSAQPKTINHAAPRSAGDATHTVLKQLEQLLLEENTALQANNGADHSYFIDKKNRILRELIVLQRTRATSAEFAGNLSELQALVARNQEILETNIRAMKEVTDALKSAALAEEADGTYTLDERRRGAGP